MLFLVIPSMRSFSLFFVSFCIYDHHVVLFFLSLSILPLNRQNLIQFLVLFNVSLSESFGVRYPVNCNWQTDYTMLTSEEALKRFNRLYRESFMNFDGTSTVSTLSSVPVVYSDASMDVYREKNSSQLHQGARPKSLMSCYP